ncbi:hypothetical protein [Kocuria palustris]|uniref:hypothetical protein n=3 Tax=Kocuria TaxID=57493 RepID=UPI003CF02E67
MSGSSLPETPAPEAPWRQESSYGKTPVHRWPDIQAFHAADSRPDGIHVIASAYGGPYELLTKGSPFEQTRNPVMVVFNGAVGRRSERTPPFLSGKGLAPGLGVPLIALSDPSLALSGELAISWYAGSAAQRVQPATEDLLRPLAESLRGDLWLVGGSAGGFAALETGHRLGPDCSVFVWNPQTNIVDYSERFVRQYWAAAFPAAAEKAARPGWKARMAEHMAAAGCRSQLLDPLPETGRPARLLYLQGTDDWHAQVHAGPYLEAHGFRRLDPGLWTDGAQRVLWFAETGEGHTPPTGETIHALLERLLAPGADTVLSRVQELEVRPLFENRDPVTRPEDLRAVRTEIAGLVSWRLRGSSVLGSLQMLPAGYGRLRWQAVVLDENDRALERSPELALPSRWDLTPKGPMKRLRITLHDGMGHVLVRRHLPLNPRGAQR